jgi:hypothetical protein
MFIHNGMWSWIQILLVDWPWHLLLPFTFSGLLICWELRLLKSPSTVIKQNVCLWRMILIQIFKCVFMKVSSCTVKFIFCVSRLCSLYEMLKRIEYQSCLPTYFMDSYTIRYLGSLVVRVCHCDIYWLNRSTILLDTWIKLLQNITVLWVVRSCRLVSTYLASRGTCCMCHILLPWRWR